MKIKAIFNSNKGESLVESVISILIFSVLLLTITLTIQTALLITANATQGANTAQDNVNSIITDLPPQAHNASITFNFEYTLVGETDSKILSPVTHNVNTINENGFRAFRPR